MAERGVDVSLREIAARAGLNLATLYRHYASKEALLTAMQDTALSATLDSVTRKAAELQASEPTGRALVSWLRTMVTSLQKHHDGAARVIAALADTGSALHKSCLEVRSAGERLLGQAQDEGTARHDIKGMDMLVMIGGMGWIAGQTAFTDRTDRVVQMIAESVLTAAPQDRSCA